MKVSSENWESLEVSQAQLDPRAQRMLLGLSFSLSLISTFFCVGFILRRALFLVVEDGHVQLQDSILLVWEEIFFFQQFQAKSVLSPTGALSLLQGNGTFYLARTVSCPNH